MKLRQHITLLRCRHEDDVMRKNSSRLFMLLELKIVYIRYSIFCTCVLLHTYSYSSCMDFLKNFLAKLFYTINIRVFVSSGSSSHFPSLHFFVSKKIRWKFLAKNRRLKTNALFSAYDIHHRFYSMTFSLSNKIYVCRLSRIYIA